MKIKLKYASILLLIFMVICIFTWFISASVTRGDYIVAIALAALLYGCSFILGKKFRKVFFLLSTLKFLKNSNGVVSITAIENHIKSGEKNRKEFTTEIIELLVRENLVERKNNQVILTEE